VLVLVALAARVKAPSPSGPDAIPPETPKRLDQD